MAWPVKLLITVVVGGFVFYAVARVCEYFLGKMYGGDVDPATLGEDVLKDILLEWGVDHSDVEEKKELVNLVRKLGPLCVGHLATIEAAAVTQSSDVTFTSGHNLVKNMYRHDSRGPWLVHVITGLHNDTPSPETSRDAVTWSVVTKRVTRLGMRTALLDCGEDPIFCKKQGWLPSRVLMVVPNDYVHVYSGPMESKPLMEWIHREIQGKAVNITTRKQLLTEWIPVDRLLNTTFSLSAVVFTDRPSIPAFLGVVSLQYRDILRVGVFRESESSLLEWARRSHIGDRLPLMLIVSLESTGYMFGKGVGEYFSLSSMQTYFDMFMPPNSKDILLVFATFFVGYMALGLGAHAIEKHWQGRLLSCTWLFNMSLIIWWTLLVPGHSMLGLLTGTPYPLIFPLLVMAPLGTCPQRDLLFYTQHPFILVTSLLLTCVCLDQLAQWAGYQNIFAKTAPSRAPDPDPVPPPLTAAQREAAQMERMLNLRREYFRIVAAARGESDIDSSPPSSFGSRASSSFDSGASSSFGSRDTGSLDSSSRTTSVDDSSRAASVDDSSRSGSLDDGNRTGSVDNAEAVSQNTNSAAVRSSNVNEGNDSAEQRDSQEGGASASDQPAPRDGSEDRPSTSGQADNSRSTVRRRWFAQGRPDDPTCPTMEFPSGYARHVAGLDRWRLRHPFYSDELETPESEDGTLDRADTDMSASALSEVPSPSSAVGAVPPSQEDRSQNDPTPEPSLRRRGHRHRRDRRDPDSRASAEHRDRHGRHGSSEAATLRRIRRQLSEDSDHVRLRQGPEQVRRLLMRDRREAVMVENNGVVELVSPSPSHRDGHLSVDYIDRLPTWDYCADEYVARAAGDAGGKTRSSVREPSSYSSKHLIERAHGTEDSPQGEKSIGGNTIPREGRTERAGGDELESAMPTNRSTSTGEVEGASRNTDLGLPEYNFPVTRDSVRTDNVRKEKSDEIPTITSASADAESDIPENSRNANNSLTDSGSDDVRGDHTRPKSQLSSSTQTESAGNAGAVNTPGFPDSYEESCQCVICLVEFSRGEKVTSLPCGHFFHCACIRRWLYEGFHTCPMCRTPSFRQ